MSTQLQSSSQLRLSTKLAYGSGNLANTVPLALQNFFWLFFLTNVAGLSPSLAGTVLLIGKVWDAINDPIIGWLSDRTRSPWGRRYPWMVLGAIPFGIFLTLQWIVPQFGSNQMLLFAYYVIISLLFDTALTIVRIPYQAIAPELTQNYAERTSLISVQTAFTYGGVFSALILAQLVFTLVADSSIKYLILAGVCAALSVFVIYLSVWRTYSQTTTLHFVRSQSAPFNFFQIRLIFQNRAFLCVSGIFLLAQLGIQLAYTILPYFMVNWLGQTDKSVTPIGLLGLATSLLMLFFWNRVRQHISKRAIYLLGMPLWILAHLGMILIQPSQINWMYGLVVIAGIGASTRILVPYSMLPDVIDADELQSGQRREGVFYGMLSLFQKLSIAIALFLVGQSLEWAGFVSAIAGQPAPSQPDTALFAIRLLYGPIPALMGIGSLIAAYFYPITPNTHAEILLRLEKKRH